MSNTERQTANGSNYPTHTGKAAGPPDKLRLSTTPSTRSKKSDNLPSPVSPPQNSSGKRSADHLDQTDSEGSIEEIGYTHHRDHSLDSSASTTTPTLCICQRDPKIPRPRNAFILYRQHHAANLAEHHPGISNPEISRIIGDQWRNQAPEVKDQWKALAEEEKQRHQQQFPNYRYQPKRNGKKGNAADLNRNGASSQCHKCGGHTMVSPTTALTTQSNSRPMLPPPTPSSLPAASPGRYMPSVNNLSLQSPHRRRDSRGYVHFPPVQPPNGYEYVEEEHYHQYSPEAKRRRFTQNGVYAPVHPGRHSVSGGVPYPGTPYREGFQGRPVMIPEWPGPPPPPNGRDFGPLPPVTPAMGPPPRPGQSPSTPRPTHEGSLVLPPIQAPYAQTTYAPEPHPSEALAKTIPYLSKITTLGRIAPPLKSTGLAHHSSIRGGVIAIEGDDPAAITEVVQYLEDFLGRDEAYDIRVADGPAPPPENKDCSIKDFLELITEWHDKSREMIRFVTASEEGPERFQHAATQGRVEELETNGNQNSGATDEDKMDTSTSDVDKHAQHHHQYQLVHSPSTVRTDSTSPNTTATSASTALTSTSIASPTNQRPPQVVPLILLHTYHLAASNAYSAAIPIADTYSPNDHWQWVATLWRGTVGADITVYVRDAGAEEMGKARDVDVRMEARCVVVRREKNSNNNAQGPVGLGVSGVPAGNGNRVVEEKTLRRLGFEISEWVRNFGSSAHGHGSSAYGMHSGHGSFSGNKGSGSASGSGNGSGGEGGSEVGSDR